MEKKKGAKNPEEEKRKGKKVVHHPANGNLEVKSSSLINFALFSWLVDSRN